jgi:phosphate-selective porin OprO/OprP
MLRNFITFGLVLGVAVGGAQSARAQDGSQEDLKARIERLEKQNQDLMQTLQKMQMTPTGPLPSGPPESGFTGVPGEQPTPLGKDDVKKIVGDYLKEKEGAKKAEDAAAKQKAEDEGYRIGSDLSMKATWYDGLLLSTANKDFSMHIGGWIQEDNVFWGQSPLLKLTADGRPGAKQGVATGVALGGIGNPTNVSLQDGTFFRRLRLMTDGNFYDNFEYTLIYAFENDQFSTIGLDEFWVGMKDVPFIGTVRLGHVKTPMGLEADMSASSRTMTFLERSSYSEAIELNQNFVTGLWLSNNYLDQRATWSFAAFRADQGASSGVFFGDGQYGLQGRVTALPIYECDGRHLMHVGLSGGWRDNANNLANSPQRFTQLRARPELRDDDPAAGGPGVITNANSVRMIDTTTIAAQHDWLLGLELLYVLGPLSVQGEYGWHWIEDAISVYPNPPGPKFTSPQNYAFSGGYIQLAYTLTGENRSYDKRLGRLDTYYFGRQGPFSNAWFVKDENGGMNVGLGAWEIAARYSFTDLNYGSGLNRIQGGEMDGWTFGLNWYANTNVKLQFDYVYDHRYDLATGSVPGYVSGLGIRMQFMY